MAQAYEEKMWEEQEYMNEPPIDTNYKIKKHKPIT